MRSVHFCEEGEVIADPRSDRKPEDDLPGMELDEDAMQRDDFEAGSTLKDEGNVLYRAGHYRDAISKYSEAIELCPSQAAFLGNRAAALLMVEDYSGALSDSLKAIKLDPVFVKAYVRAAKCYVALGQLSSIDALFSSVHHRIAHSFDVQGEIRRAKHLKKQLDDCRKQVVSGKAASELPRIQTLHQEMPQALEIQSLLLQGFLARKKYDDIIALCSKFLRQHPTCIDFLRLRATAFYYLGRIEQATSRFQEVLRLDPDNKECISLFKCMKRLEKTKDAGNTAFKAGRLQEAYDRYTEALSIDPSNTKFNAVIYCNRAAVAIKKGRHQQAIDDCTACLDTDASNIKALCRRASAYLQTEEFEAAVRDLENAKKISAGDRDVCEQLRQAKLELAKSKRKDHYKILGVSKDADDIDIKKAYRRLALQFHPDKNHGRSEEEKSDAESKFKDISESYELLSDPQKRRRFDSGADLDMGDGNMSFPQGAADAQSMFQMFFQQEAAGHHHGSHSYRF